jgi:hypothetical protein
VLGVVWVCEVVPPEQLARGRTPAAIAAKAQRLKRYRRIQVKIGFVTIARMFRERQFMTGWPPDI